MPESNIRYELLPKAGAMQEAVSCKALVGRRRWWPAHCHKSVWHLVTGYPYCPCLPTTFACAQQEAWV